MADYTEEQRGPVRYCVEYLIKGEIRWRRTMEHPLEALQLQVDELWKAGHIAATRCIAVYECTRLLTKDEVGPLAERKEG